MMLFQSPKQSNGGIYSSGTSIIINNNTVRNSGYVGIIFFGSQNLIQNNIIDSSCLVLDDGGGIYTSSPYNTISGNTVTNTIGNPSGTLHSISANIYGIYLDDLSHDISVLNNTVSNAATGIFIHTGYNNTITGNSVYRSRNYGFMINRNTAGAPSGSVHGNVVANNIFETISTSATARYYDAMGTDTAYRFGTFDYNHYYHPNADYVVSSQFINYTLSAWQQLSGQDVHSTDAQSPASAITAAPSKKIFSTRLNILNLVDGMTKITFTLPEATKVRIIIFNINGARITSLVDGKFNSGIHAAVWNGQAANRKTVGSGVYVVRMVTEKSVLNHKICFVR